MPRLAGSPERRNAEPRPRVNVAARPAGLENRLHGPTRRERDAGGQLPNVDTSWPRAAPFAPLKVEPGALPWADRRDTPVAVQGKRLLFRLEEPPRAVPNRDVRPEPEAASRRGNVPEDDRPEHRAGRSLKLPVRAQVARRARAKPRHARACGCGCHEHSAQHAGNEHDPERAQNSNTFRTASTTRSTDGMYASSICQYGYGTS